MTLLLRYSQREGVIRSVGDPPNGVAVFLLEHDSDDPIIGYGIDPNWQPDPETGGVIAVPTMTFENVHMLPADQIAEACETIIEAKRLWEGIIMATPPAIQHALADGAFDHAHRFISYAERFSAAITGKFLSDG